mmetsp:Transcript_40824/g.108022  ORF Transcript_40824/g.108022 Transcript_40824/m.108022 type:complete len:311 (+) Transcript_40824:261-1193(+)
MWHSSPRARSREICHPFSPRECNLPHPPERLSAPSTHGSRAIATKVVALGNGTTSQQQGQGVRRGTHAAPHPFKHPLAQSQLSPSTVVVMGRALLDKNKHAKFTLARAQLFSAASTMAPRAGFLPAGLTACVARLTATAALPACCIFVVAALGRLPFPPASGLRSIRCSSFMSIVPLPSGSNESKRPSTAILGASRPSIGIARRNSALDTCPSPFSSHSRKRSITRTAFTMSASRSCCWTSMSSSTCRALERSAIAARELCTQRTARVSSILVIMPDRSKSNMPKRSSSTVSGKAYPARSQPAQNSAREM